MKRYKAGERVSGLEELKSLRVVYVVPWQRVNPVSFFLSWQWRLIDSWVKRGFILRAEKINERAVKSSNRCSPKLRLAPK